MPETTPEPLAPGAALPDLTLESSDGAPVRLSELSRAALIFYPRDATPTCTNELKAFSELADEFAAAGCRLYGISTDSLASHAKFIEKQGLRLPLLSDPEGAAAEAFGVWGEKVNFGKRYMGMIRSTFLVGDDGKVAEGWTVSRIAGHPEAVLEAARQL
ncbi:peroxiredoxin [Pseudoroseicyclus tamaricis]|uniref:thioredoxin-dependent peroxiredoxin n=1 Tax=Pseudoroseicyclus tamaricis TaxID=2705421 RepID=A0A6B2JR43_9RHOB|nr:peroxiredoxin [Pseudoroseicyclus tamaricis]NDV00455.1 peroxiredoxin [Pseudoroseicyclus tamaricis]